MAVDGLSLAVTATGVVFLYAGIKGKSILATFQSVLTGKSPASVASTNTISNQGATGNLAAGSLVGQGVTSGTSGGSPAQNQALAKLMAGGQFPDWIVGQQWSDWVSLWNKESGWNQYADTRKTGLDPPDASVFAYGIAQARPYSKYPQAGWPADKGGNSDPSAQISWGIDYISQTYGSPSGAWAHELANNWY